MQYNLLICGVGGQGVLTLSEILGQAAVEREIRAIVTMDRGLSQRGGAVIAHVRLGEVYAPVTPRRMAHGLLSLELQETVGYLGYLNEETAVVASATRIASGAAAAADHDGSADPQVLLQRARIQKLLVVDAPSRAAGGNGRGHTNLYLLGTMLGLDGRLAELLPVDVLSSAIRSVLRRDRRENLSLFRRGLGDGERSR